MENLNNLCKNCKYWEHYNTMYNKSWSACGRIPFIQIDSGEKVKEGEAGIYADATDDSGLDVHLVTDADFGCTKFIEKQ